MACWNSAISLGCCSASFTSVPSGPTLNSQTGSEASTAWLRCTHSVASFNHAGLVNYCCPPLGKPSKARACWGQEAK
jgi:hypothetical protein